MNAAARPIAPEPPREKARAALRAATGPLHDRVDAIFSTFNLTTLDGYRRFLTVQARAHLPVEAALTAAGAGAVLPDWSERRRADLLLGDLAALGIQAPEGPSGITFDGAEAVLGGVYVLEGSRLGGTLLRRQVPPELPCAFLDASDPAGWRRLLAILEARLVTAAQREAAITAAATVFTAFEAAAAG